MSCRFNSLRVNFFLLSKILQRGEASSGLLSELRGKPWSQRAWSASKHLVLRVGKICNSWQTQVKSQNPNLPPVGLSSCLSSVGSCSPGLYLLFWQNFLPLNFDCVYLFLLWWLLYFMQHSYVFIVNSRREAGSRPHLPSAPSILSPKCFWDNQRF